MTPTALRPLVIAWIALLMLLALTCATSFIPMGRFNLVINVAIAAAKTLVVATVFMHVVRSGPMVKIVALAGVAWLAILLVLSLSDFALRGR
jgi:cytochrome c oxidase subunit IV